MFSPAVIVGLAASVITTPILLSTAASIAFGAQNREPADLAQMMIGEARPPAGWIAFCMTGLVVGCLQPTVAVTVAADVSTMAVVTRVHRSVNHAIRSVRDQPDADMWQLAPAAGDCEDFAITKRVELVAAGLPAGALRLATAFTEHGDYHAVLTVSTSAGTMVLDNRFADPRDWRDLPYRWASLENPDRPFQWLRLGAGSRRIR